MNGPSNLLPWLTGLILPDWHDPHARLQAVCCPQEALATEDKANYSSRKIFR